MMLVIVRRDMDKNVITCPCDIILSSVAISSNYTVRFFRRLNDTRLVLKSRYLRFLMCDDHELSLLLCFVLLNV
jgi:hypothetical protein